MYQSPIRLYHHLNIADNLLSDASQLSKTKKLINAEFAIAENGIISIENIDYNKADIVGELDNENFNATYLIHQQVWNCPSLLHFMENAEYKVAIVKYDEWREILNNETFKEYFATDFAMAFNKCSSQYIYEFNFYMLGEMMKVGIFINDEHFDVAFQNMRLFLDSGTKLFKNTNKENCTTNPDFERWVYNDFGKFVSKLPYGFSENINSFAVAGINLTVELQKLKRNYSTRISQQLTYLLDVVQPEYADLIKKNHDVFIGNEKATKSWFPKSLRLGIFSIIIAIRAISSFFSNDSTPQYKLDNLHPTAISIDSLSNDTIKNQLKKTIQEAAINDSIIKSKTIGKIDTTTFKNH
ncbi:MAG: hypothetical protein RL708_1881 [Bacteroidota bacterium]|jgi:hypothetical protein